jgi:antitoxin MazE
MAHLIRIGNSLGVRIPKTMIDQLGFKESFNLVFKITDDGLLISNVRQNREGWVEAFKTTQKDQKEDLLIADEVINEFDNVDWKW